MYKIVLMFNIILAYILLIVLCIIINYNIYIYYNIDKSNYNVQYNEQKVINTIILQLDSSFSLGVRETTVK